MKDLCLRTYIPPRNRRNRRGTNSIRRLMTPCSFGKTNGSRRNNEISHKILQSSTRDIRLLRLRGGLKTIPLRDSTDMYWHFDGHMVASSPEPFTVESITTGEKIYINKLYTQRFLSKWVYEADEYTMISVDTQCDGNKYLDVFDNIKRLVPSPEMLVAFQRWNATWA